MTAPFNLIVEISKYFKPVKANSAAPSAGVALSSSAILEIANRLAVEGSVPDLVVLVRDFIEASEIQDARDRAAWTAYVVARAKRLLAAR